MKQAQKPTDEKTCSTCQHWKPNEEDNTTGSCRAHPPAVLYDVEDGVFAIWPFTDSTDVCGEHQRRTH